MSMANCLPSSAIASMGICDSVRNVASTWTLTRKPFASAKAPRLTRSRFLRSLCRRFLLQRVSNMRFLVTAGNTRENIDRVRDWGNIFTGNTGYAIAGALAKLGDVDLLTSNRAHLAALEKPIQGTS